LRHGGVGWPDLHALDVARNRDLLFHRVEGAGIVEEGEAEFDVLHLFRRVFAVPGINRLRSALRIGNQERQFARADDRKAARLIAWIDIRQVGNAVPRHVVMVERLAELLGRIDLELDRPAGRLFDRRTPVFQRLLKRMGRRHPMGKLQLEGLVLRERGQAQDRESAGGREHANGIGADNSIFSP
jgi:hypothetical protein